MTDVTQHESFGENFTGIAPILPQSHAVLFPGGSQLLHVIEPRVRQMVADACHGEGLLAFALCEPGWETWPAQHQPCHEMSCLARITNLVHDGEHGDYVYIQGICRARVHRELVTSLPYDLVRLELLRDDYSPEPMIDRDHRHAELFAVFRRLFPQIRRNDLFQSWAEADLPLGRLCDQLTGALRIEPEQKQEILAEIDVDCRSDLLLALLRKLERQQRESDFAQPSIPTFSPN